MDANRMVLALALAAGAANVAAAQALTRVSVDSAGGEGNGGCGRLAISADGRFVAFESDATNLVPGDTNGVTDVFVHDLTSGATERVSVDSSGVQGNDYSAQPAISSDGRYVAFLSLASNLVAGDGNAIEDIFLHDRQSGTTVRVSVDSTGAESDDYSAAPSLSADGRIVAFDSFATDLVAGDTNGYPDVFVHDLATGATERVSVDSAGGQGNFYSYADFRGLSDDGRYVIFESVASNLVTGDANHARDVFFHDRTTGTTQRVSLDSSGVEGDQESANGTISGDGRFVAFESFADNLVAGDSNGAYDVFVRDLVNGTTERVSVDSSGLEGDSESFAAAISSDGRLVAFASDATDLVNNDTNLQTDAFLRDRSAGTTTRVSITDLGLEGDSASGMPDLASDGATIAFWSDASNLVPNDANLASDVFARIPCGTVASWSNYGAGLAGTLGVPALTSRSNPVLGTTVTLDLGNSSGNFSFGLIFIGFQEADIPSVWGGDLLLVPSVTVLLALPPAGTALGFDLPDRADLCGLLVDLQAIELDPGAPHGVSFTPGLELILGR